MSPIHDDSLVYPNDGRRGRDQRDQRAEDLAGSRTGAASDRKRDPKAPSDRDRLESVIKFLEQVVLSVVVTR